MTRTRRQAVFFFALFALPGQIQAAITGIYADASATNTTPATALLGGPVVDDNLWQIRTDFGEPTAGTPTVLEGFDNASENVPKITTTVGGLDATKIYDIRAIYWTHTSAGWGISAGLAGGSLVSLDNSNGLLTGTTTAGGVIEQREFKLGQVQGVTSFGVDIDGAFVARNWYDGVSYEEVGTLPPPGAITGTYIDASAANTTPTAAVLGGASGSDNLWQIGTDFGEPTAGVPTVLEAVDPDTENVPKITTSFTGLDPTKIYDVRAIYWTHETQGWGISAGLAGQTLQALDSSNGMLTGNFAGPGSALQQREFVLGQVEGVTSFGIDVDGLAGVARQWYDGMSFLEVGTVPPPGAITGTYVDASPLNTMPATALLGTPAAGDNLWEHRAGFGESDTILEAFDPGDENVPLITTTVTGLDPNKIYDIRAIYWTHETAGWGISAALSGDPLQALDNTNGTLTGNFDGTASELQQRQFVLGQIQGVSSFSVDVDGLSGVARQWYDGVSFLEVGVVPEPSSVALLLFGGLGLLTSSRRRRSR